ncbi:MAG: riboflavin synthase [Rhodospirillaceae bacterium]|nr:riboflavin synthase [Rhodospirillaceae bacterium]
MFTGIITDIGAVRAIVPGGEGRDRRFEIITTYDTEAIPLGASIACSGPCLTVIEKGRGWFAVEASAETLARTTLGEWREGTPVNLERALAAGDEMGGHIVTGHVDAVVRVLSRHEEGGSIRFEIELPERLAAYVAEKGSICLEGVSLTVNAVEDRPGRNIRSFGVNIISHTAAHTTLGALAAGGRLNMEVDLMARYVERQLAARMRG